MKLAGGEEIIAEVEERVEPDVYVKAPRMLVMQPTAPGQMGIAIVPYSAGAPDGTHHIRGSAIQSTCEAPDKLEKAYIENVSNIQIVSG